MKKVKCNGVLKILIFWIKKINDLMRLYNWLSDFINYFSID
jgi:hypothetical protein